MGQLNTLLAVEVPNYSPGTRQYTVLGPVKAIEHLARKDGWQAERVVVRHLANGNDEHLHVLSRPIPTPKPLPEPPAPPPKPKVGTFPPKVEAAATKVKETLYGKRKS